jgi:hypothetical protein
MVDEHPLHLFAKAGYDSPSFDDDEEEVADFDDDYDTQWGESPGPMSPPAQFEDEEVQVKQEPRDVGGFLDAWEDFENAHSRYAQAVQTSKMASDTAKFIDVITQVAAVTALDDDVRLKIEEPSVSLWSWDSHDGSTQDGNVLNIKQEEQDLELPLSPLLSSPVTPFFQLPTPSTIYDSPVLESQPAALYYSEPSWQDAELLGPDSVKLKDLDDGAWRVGNSGQDRKSCSDTHNFGHDSSPVSAPPLQPIVSRLAGASQPVQTSILDPDAPCAGDKQTVSVVPLTERHDMTVISHSANTSPSQPKLEDGDGMSEMQESVVVRTCQPCYPAICARELEGVSTPDCLAAKVWI